MYTDELLVFIGSTGLPTVTVRALFNTTVNSPPTNTALLAADLTTRGRLYVRNRQPS